MFAIRDERDYVIQEDFMKVTPFLHLFVDKCLFVLLTAFCFRLQAVRKLNDAKKLESSAHYSADFGKE